MRLFHLQFCKNFLFRTASCGSQAALAASGSKTKEPDASSHPQPRDCANGTTRADPSAALMPMLSAYATVSRGIKLGKSCLTRLGSRTLHIAIPQPRRTVPMYKLQMWPRERKRTPPPTSTRAIPNASSSPSFLLTDGTIGDTVAKASSGRALTRPIAVVLR